ncbi:phosphoribosyl-AMP cyclohydrolase [Akkermansiaceae bacterium]|nr:phosphoribosyl-AMP cyclohydrolase [Akkermansiaceae bacterium]
MKIAFIKPAAAIAALAFAPMAHGAAPVTNTNITEAEVEKAQQAWGAALIQISKDHKEGGVAKAKATASAVLDAAYGYNMGPVLFKPTLTVVPQTFRPTKEGALAYFVGDDPNFPKDTGFALKGWEKYEFENSAIHITSDLALTMGKVRVTNGDGQVTEVDKTWGFKKDDAGVIRIVLHHSSLPYNP